MPIFEFYCKTCGKIFEKLQLAGREAKITCPGCAGESVQKKISAPFLPSSVGRPADSGSSNSKVDCQSGG